MAAKPKAKVKKTAVAPPPQAAPIDAHDEHQRRPLITVQTIKGILAANFTLVTANHIAFLNQGRNVTHVTAVCESKTATVRFVSVDGKQDVVAELEAGQAVDVGPFAGHIFNQYDGAVHVDIIGDVKLAVKRIGV